MQRYLGPLKPTPHQRQDCSRAEDSVSYLQQPVDDHQEKWNIGDLKQLPPNISHFGSSDIHSNKLPSQGFNQCISSDQQSHFESSEQDYDQSSPTIYNKQALCTIDKALQDRLATEQGILEFQSKLNSVKIEMQQEQMKQQLESVQQPLYVRHHPSDQIASTEPCESFAKTNTYIDGIEKDTSQKGEIIMDMSPVSQTLSYSPNKDRQHLQTVSQADQMSPDLELTVESIYEAPIKKDSEISLQACDKQPLYVKHHLSDQITSTEPCGSFAKRNTYVDGIEKDTCTSPKGEIIMDMSPVSQNLSYSPNKDGHQLQTVLQGGQMSPDLELTVESIDETPIKKDSEISLQACDKQNINTEFKSDQSDADTSLEDIISHSEVVVSTSGQSSDVSTSQSKSEEYSNTGSDLSPGKQYACSTCSKTFKNKPQLSQHELVHSNVRKHVCSHCDKAFKQLCHLNQHIRTHTGDRPYKCVVEECGRSFGQLSNLKHHQRNHEAHSQRDEARLYRCDTCDRGYANESSLHAHIFKLHTHITLESEPPKKQVNKKGSRLSKDDDRLLKVKTKSPIGPRSRVITLDMPCPKRTKLRGSSEQLPAPRVIQSNIVHSTQTPVPESSVESQRQPGSDMELLYGPELSNLLGLPNGLV